MRGSSSGRETPCSGHAKFSENSICSPVSTTSIATSPSASPAAVSIDCVSRGRRSGFITSRSITTSIVCLNFLSSSIASSSSRCSPSTFTRVKPSARSSSKTSLYSPLRSRTTGALTVNFVPSGQPQHLVDDRVQALPGDRPAADRAVRTADAREEQAQVVVDLGDRADRRARVARRRLLVDRDRRRESVDRVDVGLLHHLQELPRVRRERLDVAPLALGVDRVEREAGLARAGEPRDADEAVPRQADGDVLEVVLSCPVDDELFRRAHNPSLPGAVGRERMFGSGAREGLDSGHERRHRRARTRADGDRAARGLAGIGAGRAGSRGRTGHREDDSVAGGARTCRSAGDRRAVVPPGRGRGEACARVSRRPALAARRHGPGGASRAAAPDARGDATADGTARLASGRARRRDRHALAASPPGGKRALPRRGRRRAMARPLLGRRPLVRAAPACRPAGAGAACDPRRARVLARSARPAAESPRPGREPAAGAAPAGRAAPPAQGSARPRTAAADAAANRAGVRRKPSARARARPCAARGRGSPGAGRTAAGSRDACRFCSTPAFAGCPERPGTLSWPPPRSASPRRL